MAKRNTFARLFALLTRKRIVIHKLFCTFAAVITHLMRIIMIDLKNPKWEDFHISDMPRRELKPGQKVRCGIYRAKPGTPKPKYKQHSTISIPKEIFDGHLQTGVYRIG